MVWRDFMRVRVQIDVRLPLKRHKLVKMPDDGCIKAIFKYERLPTFGFMCVVLGHSETYYTCADATVDGVPQGWISDLRAPVRRATRTGGERWLKEEGLGGGLGDVKNMESSTPEPMPRNPVNGGINMESVQNSNMRGKALMGSVDKSPKVLGLPSGSSNGINVGQLVYPSNEGIVIGPDEKKSSEVGQSAMMDVEMKNNPTFVVEVYKSLSLTQEHFLGVGSGDQAMELSGAWQSPPIVNLLV